MREKEINVDLSWYVESVSEEKISVQMIFSDSSIVSVDALLPDEVTVFVAADRFISLESEKQAVMSDR